MSNSVYYITEAMVGDEGTEDDARRLVRILSEMGYIVEYGNQSNRGYSPILNKDWDNALDQLADELYKEQRL